MVGKTLTKIVKATMADVGKAWHSNILPKHFAPGADHEYNYRPRKKRYVRQKEKKGIREELVWRGKMRDMMIHRRRVTSTKKRARVTTPAPPHLHFHRKDEEVSRMTKSDDRFIEKAGNTSLEYHLDVVTENMQEETEVLTT